jgi:hypothetical protein
MCIGNLGGGSILASAAQIQANRRNDELSNDPTTAAGKDRATQNSREQGSHYRRLWVSKAEEQDLLGVAEELWACHAPVRAQEEALVKLMVYDLFTIDRLQRIETSVLNPPKSKSAGLNAQRERANEAGVDVD